MPFKKKLITILNKCDLTDIQIHAHTNISTSTLSNMRNGIHNELTLKQFTLLRLLFTYDYNHFLDELYSEDYLNQITPIKKEEGVTDLNKLLVKFHNYKVLTKPKLVNKSDIDPKRIDYLLNTSDESITMEEVTLIELVTGLKKGTIAIPLSKKFKLNTSKVYQQRLKDKQEQNNSGSKK